LVEARKGQEVVQLSTERKHLTNILKMVAFQIESDLVEMIGPPLQKDGRRRAHSGTNHPAGCGGSRTWAE
jgi:hypothetical protein